MNRILFFTSLFLFIFQSPALANETLNELSQLIHSELNTGAHEVRDLSPKVAEQIGSSTLTKSISIQEILQRIKACEKADAIRENGSGFITYAFSCRLPEHELLTAEVLVSTETPQPEIISYQEMNFVETPMDRDLLLKKMMLDPSPEIYRLDSGASPAIRTLITMAQIGVPVALSFKAAKILSPQRTDWQKHYIAGAMISGLTILTAEGIIRTMNRRQGWGWSDSKINALSSLAGLISSIAVGAAKELVWDQQMGKGVPEFKDALYTAAGGASVSLTVAIPLGRLFGRKKQRIPFTHAYTH